MVNPIPLLTGTAAAKRGRGGQIQTILRVRKMFQWNDLPALLRSGVPSSSGGGIFFVPPRLERNFHPPLFASVSNTIFRKMRWKILLFTLAALLTTHVCRGA